MYLCLKTFIHSIPPNIYPVQEMCYNAKYMHISTRLIVFFLLFFFSFTSFAYAEGVLDAPFTSQAPTGNWGDDRFQNGCEEASVLMAMQWVRGKKTLSKNQAKKEILAMTVYQEKTYNSSVDISAQDTADRLFKEYYDYDNIKVLYGITKKDIRNELERGNLVIVPVNGQKLKNPYFHRPGPAEHMLVIRGYDAKKKEFITNDPGTRHGKLFRYKEAILESALRDYFTGDHLPINGVTRAMIVVYPQKSL